MDISVVYATIFSKPQQTKRGNAIYVRVLGDSQLTENKAFRPLLERVANRKYSFFSIW